MLRASKTGYILGLETGLEKAAFAAAVLTHEPDPEIADEFSGASAVRNQALNIVEAMALHTCPVEVIINHRSSAVAHTALIGFAYDSVEGTVTLPESVVRAMTIQGVEANLAELGNAANSLAQTFAAQFAIEAPVNAANRQRQN